MGWAHGACKSQLGVVERIGQKISNGEGSLSKQQADLRTVRRGECPGPGGEGLSGSVLGPAPEAVLWLSPHMPWGSLQLERQDGLATWPCLTTPRMGGLGTESRDGLFLSEGGCGPELGWSCRSPRKWQE